jgi:hypothetical protein
LERVIKLKDEIIEFFKSKDHNLHKIFTNQTFLLEVTYLAHISNCVNNVNLHLQSDKNIVDYYSNIRAFMKKLKVWSIKVKTNNYDMFPFLKLHMESNNLEFLNIKELIEIHLTGLLKHLEHHFPKVNQQYMFEWIWNPFNVEIETQELSQEQKDKLIELSCYLQLESRFESMKIPRFWLSVRNEFPDLSKSAANYLMPFATTYLCEKAFSCLVFIKNKYRNTLKSVENELRLALTQIEPDIQSGLPPFAEAKTGRKNIRVPPLIIQKNYFSIL